MTYLTNKLKEDSGFTFFYFTDKHKTIAEHITRFFSSTKVLHWKGFDRIISDRNAISAYHNYHLDTDTIRRITDVNDNEIGEYYAQFKEAEHIRRVFAPFNYLKSNNFHKDYPDIVFLDENISQMVTFSIDKPVIEEVFVKLYPWSGEDWRETLHNDNFEYFNNTKVLRHIINSYKSCVEEAFVNQNKSLLSQLKKFNPYDFKEYIRWGSLYKWTENSYTFPLFYYNAFDAVIEGNPIIISDASFNEYLFSYILESYNGEAHNLYLKEEFEDLKIYILKSTHKNKDTIIYRMHPRGAWSKTSVLGRPKTTEKSLSDEIKGIIEVFGIKNVGIITFKEIADKTRLLGIDIEYFGGLRGTNTLENKPVLIVIGTWLPFPPKLEVPPDKKERECIENIVWEYFLVKLEKGEIKEVYATAPQIVYDKYGNIDLADAHISIDRKFIKSDRKADVAENNPISMMNMLFFSEIYQAYHRNRGLRDNKIIFTFGWFPEPEMLIDKSIKEPFFEYDLRREFAVEKVFNVKELDAILKSYRNIFNKWRALILDIDNPGKDNTEIANIHRIWRGPGEGPYPRLIGEIRDKIHKKFKE